MPLKNKRKQQKQAKNAQLRQRSADVGGSPPLRPTGTSPAIATAKSTPNMSMDQSDSKRSIQAQEPREDPEMQVDPEISVAPEQSKAVVNPQDVVPVGVGTTSYDSGDAGTAAATDDAETYAAWQMANYEVEEEINPENRFEQALSEDIYSLMSTVKLLSVGWVFAFSIFLIQLGILILVLIDLIDMSSNPIRTNGVVNRLNIPADAGIPVTVAQFLGVILIVNFAVAEGDMLRGITHLLDGHDPHLLKQYPHAHRIKWILSGICQTLVGTMMIIDAFCLMMSGKAVIDIILNFAALDFVQYFDDAAFALGSMGLINKTVQKECLRVGKVQVKTRSRNQFLGTRKLAVLTMTVGLYIPFFILAFWKLSGRFMCTSLYVQFGDAYGAEWPYYSGSFESLGKGYLDRLQGRVVYVDKSGDIQLSYCSGLKSWTFSNRSETDDHCDYFIKSSETLKYDIMDIAGDTWYALTSHLGNVPMDWMAVTCADCSDLVCDSSVGQCVDNQCKCHDGYMGLTCEFEVPTCDFLGLDQRTKDSLPSLPFASLFMENEYVRIFDIDTADRFYDRPIYVSYNEEGHLDVFIVYTGRRWVIMGIPQDKAYSLEEEDPILVVDFLNLLAANDPVNHPFDTLQNVSATLANFVPLFFSTPVDYGTPSHQVDPISVTWFLAEADDSLPVLGYKSDDSRAVSPSFICSHCNETTNPCQHGGRCNATTTYCDCTESYGGFLCEYSYNCREKGCLNGGKCDEVFNICKECDIGYYGNLCQFKRPGVVDYEIAALGDDFFLCFNETTCLNGGWCEGNLTKCSCPIDFTGDFCEQLVDNSTLFSQGDFICANTTCINGGYCVGEATECTCPPEFTGLLCEQTFANTSIADGFFHCSNSTCLNGGYCETKVDPCICPGDYEGDYCESSSNLIEGHALCKNETCQNGGYCTSILEVCSCPEDWIGDFCEVPDYSNSSSTANPSAVLGVGTASSTASPSETATAENTAEVPADADDFPEEDTRGGLDVIKQYQSSGEP